MLKMILIFFEIGFISFGGGWASLGVIKQLILENGLLTEKALQSAISISQMTPGPVAVNLATYIGYLKYGFLGAFFNTIFLIIPAIIYYIVAKNLLRKFNINKKRLIKSLRMGTIILISMTLLSVLKPVIINRSLISLLIAAYAFILFMKTKLDPIYIILSSALMGLIIAIL
ncbi:chromate transporter [Marinitoga hydrogenitolerans DSM 16785]|uniref:Chromate transporter n=1 Tax=Marinitoga hydrogenitolerans (strain DSM 16785 / JCM 12826 / AT1271) TaxID=1122195 RepID=A0A1M4V879_MARH1|nr:chromate transporter [Marinitoga hydrogenitolerans]SHE65058.1 chromate transporter [Marinitoga hydrogenitolerans DSM 16785]